MKKLILFLLCITICFASQYTNNGTRTIFVQPEQTKVAPGDTVYFNKYYTIDNLILVSYRGGLNWLSSSDTLTLTAGSFDTFMVDYDSVRYIQIITDAEIEVWLNDTSNTPSMITENIYNIETIRSVARIIIRAVANAEIEVHMFKKLDMLKSK